MFFRQERSEVTDELFRHEWEHIQQIDRDGWLRFYCKYIWYSITMGYDTNPYEVEACHVQTQPLTTVQRYYKEKY
jgi:hypothetical protein